MKHRIIALFLCAIFPAALRAAPFEEAEVTRTVNLVSLLREMESPQPAAVGDVIKGQTALRTGGESRAELEFPDETITRVGSNAFFRFYAGARNMTLDGGTMLFSSPKGLGGGAVQAGAITAAVTGTDFLISYVKGLATRGGKVQVICLSETVVVYFTASPSLRRLLRPGEMIEIPNGAKDFPPLTTVSISQILSTSDLFESGGFGALPSQATLERIAASQQKVKSQSVISEDEQALRLALADLNSPDLDPSVVVEAAGHVASNPASVETVMEEAARIFAKDGDALLAIVAAVAKAYPSLAVSIVKGSALGAPSLAPGIAATVAALFPKLAIAISYAIAEGAPGIDASVVVEAVGYVASNPASVENVMEEGARIFAKDGDALLAIVAAVAKAHPSLAVSIVKGSAIGAPSLAPEIAATVAALFPKLAIAISYAIAEGAPGIDASVVVEAVGYVASNPASVEKVMEEGAQMFAKDADAFLAIVAAVAKAYPSLAISIAKGSAIGAPSLAPGIAATIAALFPKLAIAISYATAEMAPLEARAIALAVAAVVPDQRDLVFAAVRSASERGLNFSELGFGIGPSINPANFVNGTPPSAAPPSESTGPTPAPNPPPPIAVISPEN